MIDFDIRSLEEIDVNAGRILILQHPGDSLSILGLGWVLFMRKLRPDAFLIEYDSLYRSLGFRKFQDYLCEFIAKNKIDIIIFPAINTNYLIEFDLKVLEKLREKVFIVACFPDVYLYYDYYQRYLAQFVDLILVEAYYEKSRFKLFGTDSIFWPYSYNTTQYKDLGLNKDIDISFIGAAFKKGRKEYVDFLKESGVIIETYGLLTKNGPVTDKEMVEIFNRSKINLNFSSVDEYMVNSSGLRINNRYKQMKGRVSQILLTNSFLITEFDPTLERLFKIGPGGDIDVFRSREELLEKVLFYLAHQDLRKEMAYNSYQKARQLFDYEKNVPLLLKIINKQAGEKRFYKTQIYLDKPYLNFIAAVRFYWALKDLITGKFRSAWEELLLIIRNKSFSIATTLRVLIAISVKLKRIFIKFDRY